MASERVAKCLNGVDLTLQRTAGDTQVCLPVGVLGPAWYRARY